VQAEIDLAVWATRQESGLGVRMYAMFAEVWTDTLRLATPEVR
jgi:TetR/AcrR family transcriptional regulator, regulator of biofilm formation and stress response